MQERIDYYPTHLLKGYQVRPGQPLPFGATLVPGGINFSIFSRHADYCVLVLFEKGSAEPLVEIPFRGMFEDPLTKEPLWGDFRVGDVFAMTVFGLDPETIEYGFRMDAPVERVERGQPGHHRFNPDNVLLDPYAKAIAGRMVWGEEPDWNEHYQHRARVVYNDFDWDSDRPLQIPTEDLVIYEAHVRGFTQDPSSGVRFPGTFAGIKEKIPYLKELGINCIELMPIYEFDEFEGSHVNEETGERLMNFWGYSTVGFFAPKAGYAATGKHNDSTMVADELKSLIKELHANGIEVMLDVVFNHTAEGNEHGHVISFRGIDNATYYMLTPEGYYFNFSGTGNTLNCNNPIVRNMVLDCLRYWVAEYHIDGFRFDLATILGRAPNGAPLANPPLLESLAHDPILASTKLIAEAWDAGGLYQVGSFPAYGRWGEWNGRYRDDARKFLKGDMGLVGGLAQRLQGSPDLYRGRGPTASINFISCHDGFTLLDSVSYNDKHNWANGEQNRDGANDNNSWNHGVEGETDDEGINRMRQQQVRNAAVMLMTSQGVPMMLMGDEFGRTKQGNNNTYCHDNELTWLDWNLLEKNRDLWRFWQQMIAFRHAHPALRGRDHLSNEDYLKTSYADISWHGTQAWQPDWSETSRTLAFMLNGAYAKRGQQPDDFIYVAFNSHWQALTFELPDLPNGLNWHVFANTSMTAPNDIHEPGDEPRLDNQFSFLVGGRSSIVLVSH